MAEHGIDETEAVAEFGAARAEHRSRRQRARVERDRMLNYTALGSEHG